MCGMESGQILLQELFFPALFLNNIKITNTIAIYNY